MNKSYVIIGGTSGIGRALAIKLAGQGHRVVVSSRKKTLDLPIGVEHFVGDALEGNFPEVKGAVDGLVYCPGTINLNLFKVYQ